MSVLDDKTILLTGGTGSFGKRFTEIVLEQYNPRVIRVFSRGEKKQFDMMNSIKDDRLRFFIGDVRDKSRLHRAMCDVDVVVHAAALKQVPTCEYNPIEAVKTNVLGAANIIDVSIDNSVDRVMLISSDKAVHPVNLYGATKMTAEKLFVQGNFYTGRGRTRFSCVRYGNVIGSRGSVIPLFLDQRKSGVVSITDERMTRFWIRLDDGVNFVIGCIGMMKGGEVFIPRIPSMRIVDLADVVAPDAEKLVVGIRPGEKIHEVLLTEEEARHSRLFDKGFIVEPECVFHNDDAGVNLVGEGVGLPEGFRYDSFSNTEWLSAERLKELIKEF